MIRSSFIFFIATFILACSTEQKHDFSDANSSAIVTEINEIIAELAKAIVNGEAANVYDRYLAPDYRFTSASGRLCTREQMLEELRGGSVKFEDFQFINDAVQVYDDVVVAMGLASGTGINPGGELFKGRYRYLAVFVQKDGRWLLTAWQTTFLAES